MGRGKNTSLNGFAEEICDDGLTAFNPLKLSVNHLDVEFFLCTLLRNARAHVACADDGHAVNRFHESSEIKTPNKNL